MCCYIQLATDRVQLFWKEIKPSEVTMATGNDVTSDVTFPNGACDVTDTWPRVQESTPTEIWAGLLHTGGEAMSEVTLFSNAASTGFIQYLNLGITFFKNKKL
jgi:hypothetical protein